MKRTAAMLLACAVLGICLCSKENSGTGPSLVGTFQGDTLTVRHLLDTNGLTSLSYALVVTEAAGRIDGLTLNNGTLGSASIHTIPAYISDLSDLTSINLDSNQVSTLPSSIGNLAKLRTLLVEHNNLSQIPPELGQCSKLHILKAGHNQLTTLPTQVCSLDSLSSLFVDHNNITTAGLPVALASNTTIQGALQVDSNHICNVTGPLFTFLNLNAEPDWSTQQTCP